MTTYELTVNSTGEDFFNARKQLINDFIQQIAGAEVVNTMLGNGKIVSCLNPCNNFESVICTVYFDLDETKSYGIVTAINCGGLRFVDESLKALYDEFVEANYNIKHQEFMAAQDAHRREKEEAKLEKKRKDNEKKLAGMKAQAEKEFEKLVSSNAKITKADEFYFALGWVAKHVGTITAKMPDYLESAFVKHFGDVEHTVVDSTKVGPAGFTSQWHLSMEASLVKVKEVPAILNDFLSQNGKKLSKTSFVWDLVDKYGFKFGKKQITLDIMRCVPIEYMPAFNEGFKA
jgi:hypothetical protein